MEKEDLKQIREIFREEFTQGFSHIWEHNLEPAFNTLNDGIDKLELQMAELDKTMAALSAKVILNYRTKDT